MKNIEQHSQLGKEVQYDSQYNANILFPIPRKNKRDEIGISGPLPFYGMDIWNHYEVSWLNPKGKPVVALAEISYDCASPCIIESKSMKLYFNSFNQTQFDGFEDIQAIIQKDIEAKVGSSVFVRVFSLDSVPNEKLLTHIEGICLDELDVKCTSYLVDSSFLRTKNKTVSETLYSNLLKSNCSVTNQPDWGTVLIDYKGNQIDHEGLLKYLVSFRNHNEFHEQCIERIFIDILRYCQPDELTVYGRYTRRGGLDINPYRTTCKQYSRIDNARLLRQ